MIPNGLFSQIAVCVLSVGIIITYVKPTFDVIAARQNEIVTYKTEQEKVKEVNVKLANLSAAVSSVPVEDQRRLLTYMPDTIDAIVVPRTLEAIAKEVGVSIVEIKHEKNESASTVQVESDIVDVVTKPKTEKFSMSVMGSYDQLKRLLILLEQNEFPLEVTRLEVSDSDEGQLSVDLVLTTYSHTNGSLQEGVTIDPVSI